MAYEFRSHGKRDESELEYERDLEELTRLGNPTISCPSIDAAALTAPIQQIFQFWCATEPSMSPDLWRSKNRSYTNLIDARDFRCRRIYFLQNLHSGRALLKDAIDVVENLVTPAQHGDIRPANKAALFTSPLILLLPEPARVIDTLVRAFLGGPFVSSGLLLEQARILYLNACAASHRDPNHDDFNVFNCKVYQLANVLHYTIRDLTKERYVYPAQSHLDPVKLVQAYLAGTPFADLLLQEYEVPVPRQLRFSHTHVVAGSGAGKTTFLTNLILRDINDPDPPSLVIIDPHSDLASTIVGSDLGIEDRLIYIDPRDIEYPPALNIFAQDPKRVASKDRVMREQARAGVIQTFNYLFTGIFGAELTAKQTLPFRFMVRLLLSLPEVDGRNATLHDMLHLVSDPTLYRNAIDQLPEIPRDFFLHQFSGSEFRQTREQIHYRLQILLENETLARMFCAPEMKLNLFEELNRGSIIVIDTAQEFLKDDSSVFGRVFMSLVLQAIMERASIQGYRKDTFIIVDECAQIFDSNIDDLLTDVRKFNCGLVLAHQYLGQADDRLLQSLHGSTSIKFAARLSNRDATAMAREMHTTPEFILKHNEMKFAGYSRGISPTATTFPVERPNLKKLSPSRYELMLMRSRSRISIVDQETPDAELAPEAPQQPAKPNPPPSDDDISGKW